ncbi:hypothetical protein SANT12839_024350 [Streptomyces antimycoticus]|uniref:ABC transporter domain-containing protein n=1 Tax=Streptomyces antimycoticus TaxID=68175 RepID=A0A4D4K6L4_9ACTN|nr:hypothetical protein SANT12839_024350 [Streptomyces antimycoticus]
MGTVEQPAVVRAQGVVKRFGPTVALDQARLAVRPGEAHALVGRNGAGKSTLVSVLTGMERPDEGEVTFGGEPAPATATRPPGSAGWPVSTRSRWWSRT